MTFSRSGDRVRPRRDGAHMIRNVVNARDEARALLKDLNRALAKVTVPDLQVTKLRDRCRAVGRLLAHVQRKACIGGRLGEAAAWAHAIAKELKWLRSREPYYMRVRDLERNIERDHVSYYVINLQLVVDAIELDVSDADVSGLREHELDLLEGVIHSMDTRWPSDLVHQIVERSERTGPETFRIRAR
jgi:hypothetical protein